MAFTPPQLTEDEMLAAAESYGMSIAEYRAFAECSSIEDVQQIVEAEAQAAKDAAKD